MGKLEELILKHSWRGMDILRRYLPEDFCYEAAQAVLSWKRGTILLTTGFYVNGHAETDGPPGTLLLIEALQKLGFVPVVVTDEICKGYFEENGIETVYFPIGAEDADCRDCLTRLDPVGLIAIERCGKNTLGFYENSGGDTMESVTAPVDRLFELATVPTIGIGDGGNEIGMGKLASVIEASLSLKPCRVTADHLIVATVSNWGAIALAGALGYLPSESAFLHAYQQAQRFGYVDGFTGDSTLTEDKFSLDVGLQLLRELREICE